MRAQPDLSELFLKDGFIALNAGIGIPIGAFAERKYDDVFDFTGYANLGYNLNVSFNYTILPPIGVSVQYLYTSNAIDDKTRQKHLNDFNAPDRVIFESGNMELYGFMGGLFYTIRASNFNTDFRVMAGYINSYSRQLFLYRAVSKSRFNH